MLCPAAISTVIRATICVVMIVLFQQSMLRAQEYPEGVVEITYTSSADESRQPSLFWKPDSKTPVPLLVALHTWSSDYRQAGNEVQYAQWCQRAGWAFIHPNFRGVNKTPEAMGSDLAVADIVSAVDHAKSIADIDLDRIYCVGVSGGGHASLLMAARAPDIWAGVSAWCGISDIAQWHQECDGTKFERYARFIEQSLGGRPESSDARLRDAMRRSSVHWLGNERVLPALDINHGMNDGRAGSVPFTHSLNAWNKCVIDTQRIKPELVADFYKTQSVPEELKARNQVRPDPLYGQNQPLFRMESGQTRITLFDGGHEIVHNAALNWLAAQRRGADANWRPKEHLRIDNNNSQASGK